MPKDQPPPTDDQINEAMKRADADKRGPIDEELHNRLGGHMNDGSGAQNQNPPQQPKK